jgi:tryptophan-rich sensory protein
VSLFARDLLIPYLLWILYATYLNAGIVVLN